ncbi:MAG TPA: 50S ribosomal protein L9 [Candidatus Moranbacteria bacterium]|nr:50S ribosomal protein L9 [Candidatus Moranbacteria bacterium]HAT74519.1 50S ribosomal protein L9 [Candidatus Moranbacteria bacterium]
MQIILLQDVENLGKKGEVKNVSDGYARNFLFAKKMAQSATKDALNQLELNNKKEKEAELESLEKTKKLAIELNDKLIEIKARSKDGKLFGSILVKDVVKALSDIGVNVSEKAVIMPAHIKEIGEYEIRIVLDQNIETKIKLKISEEA